MIGFINKCCFLFFIFNFSCSECSWAKIGKSKLIHKWQFGIQVEATKRKEVLYFRSEIIPNEQAILDSIVPSFKKNYPSIALKLYKNISSRNSIISEIRIKNSGIEAYALNDKLSNGKYDVGGIITNFILGDFSISYNHILIRKKRFELSTKLGPSVYFNYFSSSDSNYYENFGKTEIMNHYKAKGLKIGFHAGAELSLNLGKKGRCIILNSNYYTPFKNDVALIASERKIDTHDYWYKWGKKLNSLYLGIGFKFPI